MLLHRTRSLRTGWVCWESMESLLVSLVFINGDDYLLSKNGLWAADFDRDADLGLTSLPERRLNPPNLDSKASGLCP